MKVLSAKKSRVRLTCHIKKPQCLSDAVLPFLGATSFRQIKTRLPGRLSWPTPVHNQDRLGLKIKVETKSIEKYSWPETQSQN